MKKNNAYTVAEMTIVLVFIGVMILITLHAINDRSADYYSRYYTAYDALRLAAYNMTIDTSGSSASSEEITVTPDVDEDGNQLETEEEAINRFEQDCLANVNSHPECHKIVGRQFPTKTNRRSGSTDEADKNNLCERLAEYINVAGKTDDQCDASEENSKHIKADLNDGEDFDSQFNENTLQFIANNGFRYFFSGMQNMNINHSKGDGTSVPKDISYYIVYVDLNGSSKPNTAKPPHPDIVPFVITARGDVIPVGMPIYDTTYLTARVVTTSGNANQSKPMSLAEATIRAFGPKKPSTSTNEEENDTRNIKRYIDIPYTTMFDFNRQIPNDIRYTKDDYHCKNDDDNAYQMCFKAQSASLNTSNEFGCDETGTMGCDVKIDANITSRHQ